MARPRECCRYTISIAAYASPGLVSLSLMTADLSDSQAAPIAVDGTTGATLAVSASCSGMGPSGPSPGFGPLSPPSCPGQSSGLTADHCVADIAVGTEPRGIAIDPDRNEIYVTNGGSETVSVINTETNTVIGAPISLEPCVLQPYEQCYPFGIGVYSKPATPTTPAYRRLYVANDHDSSISVIDAETRSEITRLRPGIVPTGVGVNGDKVYVGNQYAAVTVVDQQNNTTAVSAGGQIGGQAVAVDPINNRTYVTLLNGGTGFLAVFDGISFNQNVQVGLQPNGVAVDVPRNLIYVTNRTSHNVSVIERQTLQVEANIDLGASLYPWGIAVNSNINRVYVSDGTSQGSSLLAIDTDGTTRTVTDTGIPANSYSMVVNPKTNLLYIADALAGRVRVVCPSPDTDGDGLFDACTDLDDDNDGFIDTDETLKGSDPLNASKTPEVCDGIDNDGDGVIDEAPVGSGRATPDPFCSGSADPDGDGILNATDTDDDNDGFLDTQEIYSAIDPYDNCPNNVGSHDAWPLDIDRNKVANVVDVSKYKGKVPAAAYNPSYNRRLDLDGSGTVNVGDVLKFKGKTPSLCS